MAMTPTTQIDLGFKAPNFNLPNGKGDFYTLNDVKGKKGTVVMFICNHCPFVVHVAQELSLLAKDYQNKGFGFVAINANDIIKYPADAPEKMLEFESKYNFTFPYLFDETQEIAKAYDAACTPDFSIFDKNLNCVYRGQLDDSRPGNNEPINGYAIREVLDALENNTAISSMQKPSIGCNIKWK